MNGGAPGNQCTLRAAIQEANDNNNPTEQDHIDFNIPDAVDPGVKTITPTSILPTIAEPAIVDGYSQPGSSVNNVAKGTNAKLRIELNGTNVDDRGLAVRASNTVVKGLVINRFRGTGIAIAPSGADLLSNVKIEGNFIGTNPAGTAKRRNINGVIFSATTKSAIGGNLIGTQKDGITALGNGGTGVLVYSSDSVGTSILSNAIFDTGGLGIDLGSDGVTPNDAGDPDLGSNRFQNFPVFSSATTLSGTTSVEGTLNSRPLEQYTIQFFSRPSSDVGQTFIGQTNVFTDGSGNASFSFSPKTAVAAGEQVTATATRNTTGDTSEISAPQVVAGS